MLSEITLSDIVAKFPGVFSNTKNRRTLFTSRGKGYLIEETKLANKRVYQVMEVRFKEGSPTLHMGKYFHTIEDVEAEFATTINL